MRLQLSRLLLEDLVSMKRKPNERDTEIQVQPFFPYDEPFTVCRLCSGWLQELGQHGQLMRYRCRHCGNDSYANIN